MPDALGIGHAVEKLMDPISDIVKRLAGPAADEVGLSLQDSVRVWRAKRQYRLFEKMQATIKGAGYKPNPIALKLLLPALDCASVEDDEDLHTIWANLLANAADPRAQGRVLPSFITILKDLTTWDVKFLDALVRNAEKRAVKDKVTSASLEMYRFGPYDLQVAADSAKLGYPVEELLTDKQKRDEEGRTINLCMDTINRFGLITRNYSTPTLEDFPSGAVNYTISLSTLCIEFVHVCRKPRASRKK